MQRFPTLAVLVLALAAHANPALALGFGRVVGAATLGQPLDMSVVLRTDPGESIEPECVQATVTSGDRRLPSQAVGTRLQTVASGELRLRVVTTLSIDEPIVSLDLAVGCPPRLARQFVLFADPPSLRAPSGSQAESRPVEPPPAVADADARAATPRAETAPPPPAKRAKAATSVTRSSTPATAAAQDMGERGTATQRPRRAAARRTPAPPEPVPVLRLDPIEQEAMAVPVLRMDTALTALPSPGASSHPVLFDPEADADGSAADRERIALLETTLKRLQTLELERNQNLERAEARLREAQAERYSNPLVYALALLCGLLLLALVLLGWWRRREGREGVWWQPASAAGPESSQVSVGAETVAAFASPPPVLVDEAHWDERTVVLPPPPPPPTPAPPPPAPPAPALSSPPMFSEPDTTPRPMSAEELLDLEQQAEFFVVLGQDDAAIDLLMSHLRSTGGVSPVPYLKLLEIYRRRGDKDAYERMRERFNLRFNAYAPEWDVDPDAGQTLEAYPEVLARLQAAWATPAFVMELLDAALFRRDNGPTFDVPAYRELLFLYSVARDLAERAIEVDGVDLLLPIGEDDARVTIEPVPAAPAPAAEEAAPAVVDDGPLTLDFTLDDTPPRTGSSKPR